MRLGDPQPAVPERRRPIARIEGKSAAAREDVLVDPGVGVAGHEVSVVAHGDRLDRDPPTGCKAPVEDGEVRGPVRLADRLDHLHADDRVVRADDLAVVLEQHGDGVAQAAAAIRSRAALACAGDNVREVTRAPRWAASMASVPQPVPISSTWVPRHTGGVEDSVHLAELGSVSCHCADHGRASSNKARSRRSSRKVANRSFDEVVVGLDVAASAGERFALGL